MTRHYESAGGHQRANLRAQALLANLRSMVQALEIESKALARRTGLTLPQAAVLDAIQELGEVTGARLAIHANISQATATAILDRLEAKGLVVRYRSPLDRRIVHARLTTTGRAALRRLPRHLHRRFNDTFMLLPVARQRELLQAFEDVRRLLLTPSPAPSGERTPAAKKKPRRLPVSGTADLVRR